MSAFLQWRGICGGRSCGGEKRSAKIGRDTTPQKERESEELLAQTWKTLEARRPSYHAVLRLRVDRPDLRSQAIADELNRQRDKRITADTVRKTLERARAKFEALLVEEVTLACGVATTEELAQELRQLDLLKYCGLPGDTR